MASIDLEIDLGDGLPPSKREVTERKRTSERLPQRLVSPEKIVVTSEPIAVVISYANVTCMGCGAEHKDHRGIFVEHKLSNGVKALRHTTLKDLGPYMGLPRRIDVAPREAIPICCDCFMIEKAFREAALAAQVQSDLFNIDVGHPQDVATMARKLERAHAIQLEEEDEL